MVIPCRYKLMWTTLRGYEALHQCMEHVHAYIIERTLIVWARQAKELSLIGSISANEKKSEV